MSEKIKLVPEQGELQTIKEEGLKALAKASKELIALLARDDTPEEFKKIFNIEELCLLDN